MAKVTKVTYICDVCGRAGDNFCFLRKAIVPCRAWHDEYTEHYEYHEMDLCFDCQKKLQEVVDREFARVTNHWGAVRVKPPGVEEIDDH